MATDDLVSQGTRPSVAVVLTYFDQNIPLSASHFRLHLNQIAKNKSIGTRWDRYVNLWLKLIQYKLDQGLCSIYAWARSQLMKEGITQVTSPLIGWDLAHQIEYERNQEVKSWFICPFAQDNWPQHQNIPRYAPVWMIIIVFCIKISLQFVPN